MNIRTLFIVSLLFISCKGNPSLTVTVTNPSEIGRSGETVEINWPEIERSVKGIRPDNAVVTRSGEQVPSQVLYYGTEEPVSLIFQVDTPPGESVKYVVSPGTRETYKKRAYGRFIPERKDDYAWENDRVAYRVYGPALSSPRTPGLDVWVKRTEELIIDKWYEHQDYHHDHGEGMDCYKVGQTLGGGGCAPFVADTLWLSDNFSTWEKLDDGPLRTSFRLSYDYFPVDGDSVSMVRTVMLDAGSYFSRMEYVFSGNFHKIPVVSGMVIHDPVEKKSGPNHVSLIERASDSSDPDRDGDVLLAVVAVAAGEAKERCDHFLIQGEAEEGEPFVIFSGSGWTGAGMEPIRWDEIVDLQLERISRPLRVELW